MRTKILRKLQEFTVFNMLYFQPNMSGIINPNVMQTWHRVTTPFYFQTHVSFMGMLVSYSIS